MQQTATTPRPTPAPVTQPVTPAQRSLLGQPPVVPQSTPGLDGLGAKRAELERQLENVGERREDLIDQREDMLAHDRGDMDARITLLDDRALQLERELILTDDAIAKALEAGVTWSSASRAQFGTSATPRGTIDRAIVGVIEDAVFGALAVGTMTLFGVFVLWRGFRRFVLRRKPAAMPAIPDHSPRLEQLQQSIDVIALEVERISEAQRFLSKVLSDQAPAVGAGSAPPSSGRGR